jgi:hypothetical protein
MKHLKSTIAIALVFCLTACGKSPAQQLYAISLILSTDSNLPNLSPTAKDWLAKSAAATACSSAVLAKGEPTAQVSIDIALCWSRVPAVTPTDLTYLVAAVNTIQIFLLFYGDSLPTANAAAAAHTVSPVAARENENVLAASPGERDSFTAKMAEIAARCAAISARLR